MNPTRFRSTAAAMVAALSISLVAGCATHQTGQAETPSAERLRTLYPRHYLDSLDPWERSAEEARMNE